MGDPAGIGGEIIVKALPHVGKHSIPVIIGDYPVMEAARRLLPRGGEVRLKGFREGSAGDAEFLDIKLVETVRPGAVLAEYGRASYTYILEALKLVFLGEVAALVTCPITKASFHAAGLTFPGHTELLAHFGGCTEYVMMMANREIRVSLVTIHSALREVPLLVTEKKVFDVISITHDSLRSFLDIASPRIKVCGLNPHAGEGGIIGDEEPEIERAINRARLLGMDAAGPFPADTLFHKRDCDAFVAMYHDQGLIPVKTLDFRRTVNITLGLPFVRTSPGHGTGYDIAGKGVADPTGLIEAYRVAESMSPPE